MSIQALKVQRDIVSMEAFNITSASSLLNKILPSMVGNLKGIIAKFKPGEGLVKLNKDQKQFLKNLDKTNYLDLVDFKVPVPEGFVGDFTSYSEQLRVVSVDSGEILDTLMKPYANYLAKLISQPEHKFDTSNFFNQLNVNGDKKEKNFKELNSYITSKSHDEVKYGEVIKRNNEWNGILEDLNKVETSLETVKRQELIKTTQEIVSYLDTIITKVNNKEYDNVSPEVLRSLSEGVYQAAKELERFTVVYYQARVFSECINRTMDKLSKI